MTELLRAQMGVLRSRTALTTLLAAAMTAGAIAPAYADLNNTGRVEATLPDGVTTIDDTDPATVILAPPNVAFSLDKSVVGISVTAGLDASIIDATDIITYEFAFTNDGNQSIDASTVAISDDEPLFGPSGSAVVGTNVLSAVAEYDGDSDTFTDGDTNTNGVIDPGETWIYRATYELSQTDINNSAGVTSGVENTVATVTASSTGGTPGTLDVPGSTLTATTDIPLVADIVLAKTASPDGTTTPVQPGTTVTYTFDVTYTGNVTVTNVTVSEDVFTNTAGDPLTLTTGIDCGSGSAVIASMAPGDTASCTATYIVQSTDL